MNFLTFILGLLLGAIGVWFLVMFSDKRFQESMTDAERLTYNDALNRYLKRGKKP
jgi:hypothetical protein